MGSYLSKPKLEKTSEDFDSNKRYDCGLSGMQGWRSNMEDSHNCMPDVDENMGFFGVYDGHGGSEVAHYCAIHFFDSLRQTSEYKEKNYEEALRKNFLKLDAEILGPNAQKELKILSQLEPGAPLPSIEALKNMDLPADNPEEDANEARLLEEEAQMNIEDVLARYQQDVNAGWSVAPSAAAATSTKAEKSPSKSSGRKAKAPAAPSSEDVQIKTEVKDEPVEVKSEEVKEETAATTEAKEGNDEPAEAAAAEDVKSSGDSVEENKKVEEEECKKSTTDDVQSSCVTSTGTSPPKKLVKVKPPKRSSKLPTADDDSEDDEDFQFGGDSDDEDNDEDDDSEDGLDDDDDEEDESEDGDAGDDVDVDGENVSYLYDYLKGSSAAMMVEVPGSDSGTTAVVALLHETKLFVANAGDSRCVVSRSGKAFDMSDDHKPEDDIELERIKKAGGHVNEQGRVNGGLNLSRAIGDHCYKKNKELSLEDQMITAKPDVRIIDLTPGDDFMVLACDGVWNVMSSQEVIDFVRCRLNKDNGLAENGATKQLSGICEEIFQRCLAPDTMGDGTGCDNMTCMVVRFDQKWLTTSSTNNNSSSAPVAAEKQVEKNGTSVNTVNGEQLHASCAVVVTDADSQERKRSCDGDDDVTASKQAKSE